MDINILVVDDEKELADVIELYLKNDGCNVYKFYTGGEALTCIENTQLDLAILDVMLPDILLDRLWGFYGYYIRSSDILSLVSLSIFLQISHGTELPLTV